MVRHDGKYVSYLRVSTGKQAKSGLGLAARRSRGLAERPQLETGRRGRRDRERQERPQPALQ